MKAKDEMNTGARVDNSTSDVAVADPHAPRKMTFAENLILTIKVLAVLGLIGAAIWGIRLWKAAS